MGVGRVMKFFFSKSVPEVHKVTQKHFLCILEVPGVGEGHENNFFFEKCS